MARLLARPALLATGGALSCRICSGPPTRGLIGRLRFAGMGAPLLLSGCAAGSGPMDPCAFRNLGVAPGPMPCLPLSVRSLLGANAKPWKPDTAVAVACIEALRTTKRLAVPSGVDGAVTCAEAPSRSGCIASNCWANA